MEPVVAVCNKHITVNSDEANRLEEYMQSVISDTKAKQALLKDANDNLRAVRDTKTKAINEQIAEDKVAFPKESQTP